MFCPRATRAAIDLLTLPVLLLVGSLPPTKLTRLRRLSTRRACVVSAAWKTRSSAGSPMAAPWRLALAMQIPLSSKTFVAEGYWGRTRVLPLGFCVASELGADRGGTTGCGPGAVVR